MNNTQTYIVNKKYLMRNITSDSHLKEILYKNSTRCVTIQSIEHIINSSDFDILYNYHHAPNYFNVEFIEVINSVDFNIRNMDKKEEIVKDGRMRLHSSGICFVKPEKFEYIFQFYKTIMKERIKKIFEYIFSKKYYEKMHIDIVFFTNNIELSVTNNVHYYIMEKQYEVRSIDLISGAHNKGMIFFESFDIIVTLDSNDAKKLKVSSNEFDIISNSELKRYRNNVDLYLNENFTDVFNGELEKTVPCLRDKL